MVSKKLPSGPVIPPISGSSTIEPIMNISDKKRVESPRNFGPEHEKIGESQLQDTYIPKVFVSFSVKGLPCDQNCNGNCYTSILVDHQLQFESYQSLAKSMDMQLTRIEEDLIGHLQ